MYISPNSIKDEDKIKYEVEHSDKTKLMNPRNYDNQFFI